MSEFGWITPPRQAPPDTGPTDAEIARRAAVSALASNAVMLAVVLTVNIAIAKRDDLLRLWHRAVGTTRRARRETDITREVAEFRADVHDISRSLDLSSSDPERVTDGEP